MATREDIREGIDSLIERNTVFTKGEYSPLAGPISSDKREMWCDPAYLAGEILSYLHSQGVVIKVKRELPAVILSKDMTDADRRYKKAVWEYAQETMVEAGYVATKPLIKEK